jgi:hypothetical protein
MADPGCDYRFSPKAERCGGTPTEMLAVGMFHYARYCSEHLIIMQKTAGGTTVTLLPFFRP